MNTLLENIILVLILIAAIGYLVAKFVWNPFKKKSAKDCSDNCGCH